jgi:hypothetical protein
VPYVPSIFRGQFDPETIQSYLEGELLAISRELAETTVVELRPIYVAPTKPREGMIVFADGTEWNPGAGKGVYTYLSGAWSKL